MSFQLQLDHKFPDETYFHHRIPGLNFSLLKVVKIVWGGMTYYEKQLRLQQLMVVNLSGIVVAWHVKIN